MSHRSSSSSSSGSQSSDDDTTDDDTTDDDTRSTTDMVADLFHSLFIEANQLKRKIDTQTRYIDRLKNYLSEVTNSGKETKTKLTAENETLQKELDELKTALTSFENDSHWLIENQSLTTTIESLKMDKLSLETQIQNLKNQVSDVESQLSIANQVTTGKVAAENAANMSAMNTQMEQLTATFKTDNSFLELQIKNNETKIRILEAKLTEARMTAENLRDAANIEALNEQISLLADKLALKEFEVQGLKEQVCFF